MIASEGNAYLPNNAPLVILLLAANAKVDTQDSRGRSSLYRAAAVGKDDVMKLLFEKGASPNIKAGDGTTPLIAAVSGGKLTSAILLLDHGADVNLADANGNTPLMIAAEGSPYIKNPADFVSLLLERGAKLGLIDHQDRTALKRATDANNTAVIELLKRK
jgi:ankyrin repeat protein